MGLDSKESHSGTAITAYRTAKALVFGRGQLVHGAASRSQLHSPNNILSILLPYSSIVKTNFQEKRLSVLIKFYISTLYLLAH